MDDTGPAATSASPAGTEDLARNYRDEFPILGRKTYLNSNSLGALSKRSIAERHEFERLWNEMGASAWYEIWWNKLERLRAMYGMTIGAPADSIALMPSVSGALAGVSGGLHAAGERRRKIVITALDFPTLGHHYYSREALGYEVVVVPSRDGVTVPLEAIRRAVDEDTLLLATSHVFFTSGTIQDAGYLAEIAHDAGAYILLDAYQSNGQVPIDVRRLGVDFLTSGSLKWLCGGPGAAYLYVDPDVDIVPTTLSWFGVENQFGFDLRAKPRSDARRFELGTPAVGCAYTAVGGLSIVLEAGIERIHERNRVLARDLRERLADAGFDLHQADGPDVRSALVLIEHVEAQEAVKWLAENDVIVDSRGSLVRFSPHFYNTIDDNARAVEVLVEMDT
ncbi:MAG: aminotransferase class V-fold PLP-dependent enzyme [Gemmatimonadota bacterium]|nr:aminotransferase class V-fold PLP-dependent enzyme [Gemmatimonadota bacterium]